MKMKIMSSIIAAGILATAGSVIAQTNTYNITANPAAAGSTGKYDVVLQKWNGTANGAATQFRVSLARAEAFPTSPNAAAYSVALTFFSYLGAPGAVGTIPVATITGTSGVTTTVAGNNPDVNTKWNNHVIKFNGTTILKNQAAFDFLTADNATHDHSIKTGHTNAFLEQSTGRINLKYKAYSVKIVLMNAAGTRVWSGIQNLSTVNAPEGSSLALLATGLVPLGFVVRRRARKQA